MNLQQYRRRRRMMMSGGFFAPADVSGNVLWWDFGDPATLFLDAARLSPVTSDSDPIKGIMDKSPRGSHGSQSTTSKAPAYTLNTQNGLSGALFDGTDDYLTTPAAAALDLTVFTMFMVLKLAATGQSDRVIAHKVNAYGLNLGYAALGGSAGKYGGHRLQAGTWSGVNSTTGQTTSTIILATRYDGADFDLYVNNALEGTTSDADLTALSGSALELGGDAASGLNGSVCDWVIYNSALPIATDFARVMTYLNLKWGVY